MLAWMPSPQPHAYTPTYPSPLTPRSTNACSQSANSSQQAMEPQKKPSPRAPRPNPLMQRSSADATRERRRDLFLKKVANDRDERRWAGRSEQIMRLDYVQRQRAWEARLARSAPTLPEPDDEDETGEDVTRAVDARVYDEDDVMVGSSQGGLDARGYDAGCALSDPLAEAEVEDIAAREEQELNALLAMMEEEERRPAGDDVDYGSDDDDYDTIFAEALRQEQHQQQQARQEHMSEKHDYDAMDMS